MLLINGKEIKLAVFDMDGLIFDSEKVYFKKWQETAEILGYRMSFEQWVGLLGTNEKSEKIYLQMIYGADCPADRFRSERIRLINEYAEDHGFPLKKGVREILGFFKENNIPSVIATSSERSRAEKYLKKAGVFELFDDMTCGDEVSFGKPDAELFLKAAEKRDADPVHCVVFEDSENGIIAAERAGMIPVCVPDLQPVSDKVRSCAFVIESLDLFPSITKSEV